MQAAFRLRTRLYAALIVVAVAAAYADSMRGQFVFDDTLCIPENPSIRHLWPLWQTFSPPQERGRTVEGRPVLNLTFALNHAAGGTEVWGYHAANVLIHALACLLLFGIVRRTLRLSTGPLHDDAEAIAGVCALVWGLHPLQTESVTYISQRAESLMGLFFLSALYGTVRAAQPGAARLGWTLAAVGAALLCAGTKEVAVTLPVIVLLFDRTFLAGSFREAWRQRRPLYLGLALSWILAACLILHEGDRGGTIGARAGITHWEYALCQARGVFGYLRLCFWPHPLVFDYGTDFVSFTRALPFLAAWAVVLGTVAYGLIYFPMAGFLGAWFLIILAPTSSFLGGTRQMLAEHRMYLPLAAVVVGTILLLYRYLGRKALAVGGAMAAALALATIARNLDYQDSRTLYRDTVLHRPLNAWARNNYGIALATRPSLPAEARAQYEAAIRINPDYAAAHNNYGLLLATQLGQPAEARRQYEQALRINPDYPEAHNNYGILLATDLGRPAEARRQYETALRLNPGNAEAHNNLGYLLATQLDQPAEARRHYEEALRLNPDSVKAHNNYGTLLATQLGDPAGARRHFEAALRLNPDDAEARASLLRLP